MSISSISQSSISQFTSVQFSSSASTSSQTENSVEGSKPPGPPPGGGKGPRGGGKGGDDMAVNGPDLDSDSDGSWSTSELEDYASYSESTLGISLNTSDILSTYDTDEDGSIDADERVALAKNDAFKLSSTKSIISQMQSNSVANYPVQDDSATEEDTSSVLDISFLNNQAKAAYKNNSQFFNQILQSNVSYDI